MNKYSQQGWSMGSLILVLVLVAFFMLCAFKLVPVYVENYYITNGLQRLGDDPEKLQSASKAQILKDLQHYFLINNVRSPASKRIEIERTSDGVLVINQYETRVPLFANIDVILSFHNVLNSARPDDCCAVPATSK